MRTAPAVRVEVTRFGQWRLALLGVLLVTGLLLGSWWVSHAMATGRLPPSSITVAWFLTVLLSAGLTRSLARVAPFDLFWDGQCWFLTDPPGATNDPLAGDLDVAVDLGGWLLLRFSAFGVRRRRWLPVQRRGLEPAWHALRCAVYSPRPAPDAPVVATAGE